MPSVVQTASNSGTGTSITVTLASATTAGNCLVVHVTGTGSGAPSVSGVTIGGSASNFGALKSSNSSNGFTVFVMAASWACPNCPGGQTSVVVSGTNLKSVVVDEVSGLASTFAALLDQFNTGGAGSGTAWSSGTTPATTNAAEYIGGVAIDSGTMTGPGAPWTNTSPVSGSIAGRQISSATGTFTYSGTSSLSAAWAAVVVTLFPAAAPPTPAPFSLPRSSTRGQAARRGSSSSSRGAPVVPPPPATPSPFTPPRTATRGRPGAVTGALSARSAGAPVAPTPAPFRPPARSSRPVIKSRRGTSSSSRGAPVTAPPAPKTLLISLASAAGTDDYGTAYPQGILATAGVIQGPEFVGNDFIINTSGYFLYSGTPAAGNLIASIAPAPGGGVDTFGNNYVQGAASYSSNLASALTAGSLTTYSGSLALGWNPRAVVVTNSFGDLLLEAASGRQVLTTNNILDGGGGGATFQADVSVDGVNLNVGNGTNAKVNLNPPMASPPGWPTSGTTLANTQTCLDAVIQSLKNRGLMA